MHTDKREKNIQVPCKKKKPFGKERFLAENAKYAYELEVQREHSIIEQTSRMLVFQSLVLATLYAALPSVLNLFEGNQCTTKLTWILSVIITVFSVLGLGVTLAAQWRYKYESLPNIDKTKQALNALPDSCCYEKVKCTYNEKYITIMYKSLEQNNNLRCKLLKVAMVLLYVTLAVTFVMIMLLIVM